MKRMLPVVLDLIREYGTNDPYRVVSVFKNKCKEGGNPRYAERFISLCIWA